MHKKALLIIGLIKELIIIFKNILIKAMKTLKSSNKPNNNIRIK